jgi:PAS domain S-box-containing protein
MSIRLLIPTAVAMVICLTVMVTGSLFSGNHQANAMVQHHNQWLASHFEALLSAPNSKPKDSFAEAMTASALVAYIHLYRDGERVAQFGNPAANPVDAHMADVHDDIFDTRQTLAVNGQTLGEMRIGYAMDALHGTFLPDLKSSWPLLLLTAVLILAAFLLAEYLARPLRQLTQAVDSMRFHGPSHQISTGGLKETRALAECFNATVREIKQNINKLQNALAQEQDTRKLAQQVQDKNDAILNASLDAMITIDQDGKVVDYNQVAEQVFGWRTDEISGQVLSDFIIPHALRDAHQTGMAHFRETGEGPALGQRLELTALRKSGEEFPIEIAISPIDIDNGTLFTAFIRDISRRRQAETELRIAAHAFESTEAIIITDAKGCIIRVNQAFSRITGYQPKEVIGRQPNMLSSPWYDKSFYQDMWSQLTETGSWTGEVINQRKNGETFPEHLNINAVLDDDGKPSHYIAHFVDISEQKNYETALLSARREAEQASIAKSRFLAAMSHEIRTPMNGVLGVLGLLRDTHLTPQQQHMVTTARESGEHLLTIINDILDFSKMEANKLSLENSDFSIKRIITQVHELLLPQAKKKGLQLRYTVAEDVPERLNGDPDRLRQILINLINNAIKFTHTGQVAIRVTSVSENAHSISVRFEVEDSGIGISSDDQQHLFDEFTMADQSLSRKEEGSGLGLAICKRLVKLMDGEIGLTSELNVGSRFYFVVPLQPAATIAEENDSENQAPWMPTPGLRVLLAEDNSANQYVFKSILDNAQLIVDVAANGEEAVEACRLRPYDIVLMDISMPVMDGIEATQRIRQLNEYIYTLPIVALTAHALDGDRERFLEAGMNDYLTKPLTGHTLLGCIARWTQPAQLMDSGAEPSSTDNLEEENEAPLLVVDPSVLQQLARDTSQALIPKLMQLFVEDAEQRLNTLQQACEQEDIATLEFQAHTLGSSAATHGLPSLCQHCRDIEQLCRMQQTEQALAVAAKLPSVASISLQQLQQMVAEHYAA